MLKNKVLDYFRPSYMQERLFKMLKTDGVFIRNDCRVGFLYSVQIGEIHGKPIFIEVGLKAGKKMIITNAFIAEIAA
ncbi:hypothetical protein [Ferdinandcohnia sp. SAFN-114]|uniref:hypothetical protein n=1 Tax=Ferdinandcohnia sp. SAFN-114 TaxID=3387275 RepID=UPI003F7E5466